MTDYAVCPHCEAVSGDTVCSTCGAVLAAPDTEGPGHYGGLWARFIVASVPAAILALFVESTLYGYVLYLGVFLTYCAWVEATAPLPAEEPQGIGADTSDLQLTTES